MTIDAYPLTWPPGKPRQGPFREKSRFRTTRSNAWDYIDAEVGSLGGSALVISSNLPLRRNGLQDLSAPQPADTGVAVYFVLKRRQMCFACDRWNRVEDNATAIAHTIAALRGIERWGSGSMIEQAFTGFVALPAPEQPWQTLGVRHDASREEIESAWRRLAAEHHPDRGGDSHRMARINAARDAMLGR